MTQNQLKYWELRWKQHYESAQLDVDKAKLSHEIARLNETIRHNRVSERQEKQRLIIEQQKVQQNWAQISFDYQAKIIELGMNAARIRSEWETKMKSLDIEERKLAQNEIKLAQEAEKILDNKLVIVSDIMTTLKENQDKDDRERMRILADAVGPIAKGLGAGMVGVLAAKVESTLKTSQYQDYLHYLQESYPETFRLVKEANSVDAINKGSIRYKDYQETYGPEAPKKIDRDIKRYLTDKGANPRDNVVSGHSSPNKKEERADLTKLDDSTPTGVTTTSVGSTKEAVHYSAPTGTSIIYSPGSHYGPGF